MRRRRGASSCDVGGVLRQATPAGAFVRRECVEVRQVTAVGCFRRRRRRRRLRVVSTGDGGGVLCETTAVGWFDRRRRVGGSAVDGCGARSHRQCEAKRASSARQNALAA